VPTSDIPYENEEKCAEWLHKLFQEKVDNKKPPPISIGI
jgi:hypothetical protein